MAISLQKAHKPWADWDRAKLMYESGAPDREIADNIGVSHTAVQQRAKKGGWIKGDRDKWLPVAKETQTAAKLASVNGNDEAQASAYGKRSTECMVAILSMIEAGATQRIAALSCGISESTLGNWKKDDPDFEIALTAAEARTLADDEGSLVKARNKGDWKAGLTRLERHRLSRDQYKAPEQSKGGTSFTINLNWDRAEEPKVIEHEAAD